MKGLEYYDETFNMRGDIWKISVVLFFRYIYTDLLYNSLFNLSGESHNLNFSFFFFWGAKQYIVINYKRNCPKVICITSNGLIKVLSINFWLKSTFIISQSVSQSVSEPGHNSQVDWQQILEQAASSHKYPVAN